MQNSPEKIEGPCPVERGMRLIGGKWTASILWHLKDGPLRYNELARQLTGASRKIISQRLTEMEARGLLSRKVISTKPFAVSYELRDFGLSAVKVLERVDAWAASQNV